MTQKHIYPLHEQLLFGSLLTMLAGSLDAYSYLFQDGVFSGLQTGNLIMIGIHLSEGDLLAVARLLTSIIAFGLGVIFIFFLQQVFQTKPQLLRRTIFIYQFVLLTIILVFNSVFPTLLKSILLAFVSAAILQGFRKLKGAPFTPIMMTGNIRTLFESLFHGFVLHEESAKIKARDTIIVIATFVLGSISIAFFKPVLAQYTLFLPLILVAFILWLLKNKDLS